MASKITKIIANFETQLASTIAVSGTTGSLKSPVLDDDGVQAVSGKYIMCVDLGLSKEEHLLFDLDGLTGAMTNIKSVSRQGVETVGAVRQHRSGAKVALTNFANLLYISKILTGEVALDGLTPLIYDVAPTFSNVLQLATKGYVDATLSGAVGTANESLHGTTRISRTQGAKQKARAVWAREQDTPDKTLKIESFKLAFTDKIFAYTGGNTPNFIDPAFGGDLGVALTPANGETITVTVDGVATILTFVTSIGASAGNILIGGSASVARANLVAFLNAPSVTNANQIAVTGTNLTAIQKLSATDDLALNAFIRVTNPATTSFSVSETMAGAGNIWTVNSTKNRYDLVVLNSAGALTIRRGAEAVSPTVPTPTNGDVVICSVLNRVGQTTVRDYDVSGQAYITDWYDLSVYRTDLITASALPTPKFGGTGADGALVVSSGTTTLDLAGAQYFEKNYSSISITGTGTVVFINPHANGSIITIKCSGNCDMTSSNPAFDTQGMGASGGASVVAQNTAGNAGSLPTIANGVTQTASFGQGGATNGAGPKNGSIYVSSGLIPVSATLLSFRTGVILAAGAGGGSGSVAGGGSGTSGAGGRGGGGLYMEIGGAINFTGSIRTSGSNGADGTGNSGSGGGGGSAGTLVILYNTLISVAGTLVCTGGNGGTSVNNGYGNGAGGGAGSALAAGGDMSGGGANGSPGSLGSGGGGTCNFGGTPRTGGAGGTNGASLVAKNNYY